MRRSEGDDDRGTRHSRRVSGTFDPFTNGHRDVVNRARSLFAEVTVLVAVNGDKQPGGGVPVERADSVRRQLPTQ